VSAVEALNSLPKMKRPAKSHSAAVQAATAHITSATTAQQHSTTAHQQPPLEALTGPLTGVTPVGQTSTGTSTFPVVMPHKSSNKAIFLILGLVAAVVVVILLMSLSGGTTENRKSPTKDANIPAKSDNSGLTYAERHAIEDEKIIIADFDGAKPAASNPGWLYSTKTKQKAVTDGWSINTGKSAPDPGIKFAIKSHEYDMFDLGWKLTYIVRPIKGSHKLGFHVDKALNPGWEGGDVCLYLVVKNNADGMVDLSARDAEHQVKSNKSISVPYNGADGWHTIVIEQKPEDEAGNYSVSIDGKATFKDTFTKGKDFSGWNNHLFSYGVGKDSDHHWVVKEFKLETL
jgi:hypothetical protein